MLAPGTEFAEYRIESVLGTGGMGVVYLAQHPRLPRKVALKVMSDAASADQAYRKRFEHEARIIADLQHPNIVDVYDTGDENGVLWLSMPCVEGPSVDAMLTTTGALPVAQVLAIVRPIAAALDYAHSRGVLHRDVKPANILVDENHGTPYLVDFGLARTAQNDPKLTVAGLVMVTPDFAAPEQLMADPLGPATDVYALAATIFAMLTARLPFPGNSPGEKLTAHLHAPPPAASPLNPTLPPAVDAVLARGMAKNPAQRPQSAQALVDELDRALAPRPPGRGRSIALVSVGVVAVAAIGIGAAVLLQDRGSRTVSSARTSQATTGAAQTTTGMNGSGANCLGAETAGRRSVVELTSYDRDSPDEYAERLAPLLTDDAFNDALEKLDRPSGQVPRSSRSEGLSARTVDCDGEQATVAVGVRVREVVEGGSSEGPQSYIVTLVAEGSTWKAAKFTQR